MARMTTAGPRRAGRPRKDETTPLMGGTGTIRSARAGASKPKATASKGQPAGLNKPAPGVPAKTMSGGKGGMKGGMKGGKGC